jgi:hypothetical protein
MRLEKRTKTPIGPKNTPVNDFATRQNFDLSRVPKKEQRSAI